jgi:hypothetical protein
LKTKDAGFFIISLLLPVAAAAVYGGSDKLLKQILKELKINTQLMQDDTSLLLNATKNTTSQLQKSDIYLQNQMVENHNLGTRLLQALSNK